MKVVEYNTPKRKIFGVNVVDKIGERTKENGHQR